MNESSLESRIHRFRFLVAQSKIDENSKSVHARSRSARVRERETVILTDRSDRIKSERCVGLKITSDGSQFDDEMQHSSPLNGATNDPFSQRQTETTRRHPRRQLHGPSDDDIKLMRTRFSFSMPLSNLSEELSASL